MTTISDITLVWISIVLEALPFVLLGAALAAALETLVPAGRLERLLAASGRAGIPVASVLGLVVPVCDCAVFPVVRKLLAKGWAPSHATAFLCASASLSPAVIAATWWAFPGDARMVVARSVAGILTGWVAGVLVHFAWGDASPLRRTIPVAACTHHHRHHGDGTCGHGHEHPIRADLPGSGTRFRERLTEFVRSMSGEFADNMLYVLAGSLVAAAAQVLVPRDALLALGAHPTLAVPAMMAWGFALCLCAHADAFVAATFAGVLPSGALLAFMSFGGMLDAKNLLLWLSSFRPRFVWMVAAAMFAVALSAGLLLPDAAVP